MKEVEAVISQYLSLSQACSSIYFTMDMLNQMHALYQVTTSPRTLLATTTSETKKMLLPSEQRNVVACLTNSLSQKLLLS